MRILTVRPPWADLIIRGGKTVENRSRNIAGGYRGPVAIHAAKVIAQITDVQAEMIYANATGEHARDHFDAWMGGEDTVGGAIIGVVELVDVHRPLWDDTCTDEAEGPCSPWAEVDGWPHHLVLANARPLTDPIPYRGALGLRELDAVTVRRVLAALA